MRGISLTRYTAIALVAGALACARNQETGTASIQDDSTAVMDTIDQAQNPSGYRGIEQDTSQVRPQEPTPVDTFLQQQGTNPKGDTSGYQGIERDTTSRQADSLWPGDSTQRPYDSTYTPKDTSSNQP